MSRKPRNGRPARRKPRAKSPASTKAPTDDDAKHQLEYAKEVDEYSEYALYVVALKAQPKDEVDLVDTLIKQNPKSQYLPEVGQRYFAALSKAGEGAKACPAADEDGRGSRMRKPCCMRPIAAGAQIGRRSGQLCRQGAGSHQHAHQTRRRERRRLGRQKEGIIGSANFYAGVGYTWRGDTVRPTKL